MVIWVLEANANSLLFFDTVTHVLFLCVPEMERSSGTYPSPLTHLAELDNLGTIQLVQNRKIAQTDRISWNFRIY